MASLEEQLEDLLQQKGAENDKIELRKIRAKIRKTKRALGTYVPKDRQSFAGLSDLEKHEQKRQAKEERAFSWEKEFGPKYIKYWEAQPQLHGPLCACVKCQMIRHRNVASPPLREWAALIRSIIEPQGKQIPNGWIRMTYSRIRKGERPKHELGKLLEILMLVSGW